MHGVHKIRATHGFPALRELDPALARVARWEVAVSLAVPWVCLAIFALAAAAGWWPLAVLATVLLSFFTYGSVSHDLVHANLGLPRRVNRFFLTATELLAVRSGHAYRAAHLHHHARFPADDDLEGAAAGMGFVRSILEGFLLQPRLWLWAVRRGGPDRPRIVFEGLACLLILAAAAGLIPLTPAPAVFVALMIAGSWIIPLVTSHIPHTKHADDPLHQTRRFRGRLFSLLAVEHLIYAHQPMRPYTGRRRRPGQRSPAQTRRHPRWSPSREPEQLTASAK